nr:hypothetical protein [Tanacetum cinerariifolium]
MMMKKEWLDKLSVSIINRSILFFRIYCREWQFQWILFINKENVVDFDFDVVEESKEFQKLSLTHAPQVPTKESKEFQKLSLTDMLSQPKVPKKKVDDGGKQLEHKPVAAREESKEFQKLSLTHVPQVPTKESKEFQKLSLTDMPSQPKVPKKKVDDGGKQLEHKPVAARAFQKMY